MIEREFSGRSDKAPKEERIQYRYQILRTVFRHGHLWLLIVELGGVPMIMANVRQNFGSFETLERGQISSLVAREEKSCNSKLRYRLVDRSPSVPFSGKTLVTMFLRLSRRSMRTLALIDICEGSEADPIGLQNLMEPGLFFDDAVNLPTEVRRCDNARSCRSCK